MAEAGEEGKAKRCNCGFWGSPQTLNMCSKCYKDYLQKGKPSTTSTGPEQSAILKQLGLVATSSEASASSNDEQVHNSNQDTEKREEVDNKPEDPFLPSERPQQKNKKKCWVCKTKLELAQRELGTCKCGYVFCFLHRLPEQHSCIYDHKEGGRQHALKVMVPAGKKKIGRSFHRMDSRPE